MISSSSFRDRRARRAVRWLVLFGALLLAASASASGAGPDATRPPHFLTHRWGPADGLAGGRVNAIAETPDGYLWIGTDAGLQRFDGFRFQAMQPPTDELPPIRHVLGLTLDRDGALWIFCEDGRLIRYTGGSFQAIALPPRGEHVLTAMGRANDGGVLTVGLVHGLMHAQAGHVDQIPLQTTALLIALAQAPDGRIWIGTREAGILTWKDGRAVPLTAGVPDLKINCLLPLEDGTVWMGSDNGLALWDGREIVQPPGVGALRGMQVLSLVEDTQRRLWIGTSRGLLLYDGAAVRWVAASRSSGITALFRDRQGDVWLGDGDGLERISGTPLLHYGEDDGLPHDRYGPVFVDAKNRTWFAPIGGGLFWMRDGVVHAVKAAGLDTDVTYSLDGDATAVWAGRQRGGITRLRFRGDALDAQTFTVKDGLAEDSVFALRLAHDGSVWAGTLTRGLSHWKDGRFTTVTRADGLASNTISSIEEDGQNALWVGTPDGLSRWDGLSWQTFTAKDGLPTSSIKALAGSPEGVLWIGTRAGLAYATRGRIEKAAIPSLNATIRGIVQAPQGTLWIATHTHLASVRVEALLQGHLRPEQVRLYNAQDGLDTAEGEARARSLVTDAQGRIWLATSNGLIASTSSPDSDLVPTQPRLESVSTDAGPLPLSGIVHVPAGSRRVIFHFTGIFLRDPDRVRFRYRLENFDEAWSAPTQEHEAVYTNLAPGDYRFRLMATNGDGTWNTAEQVQPIRVNSLLWQSWPFQLLGLAVVALLGIYVYRARMRFLIAQANRRSEERLSERTAIARDLHDTLLQSFHALILFFQMGVDQLPRDAAARNLLEDALRRSDDVMREGRERLISLRSTMATPDLPRLFHLAADDLRALYPCLFELHVEGEPRAMQTIAQEELAYLGREALTNAFRHAHAERIQVQLRYAADSFRMTIADDGQGIPPAVLRRGAAPGHWGLTGMRERARKIGAHFDLYSKPETGTIVTVRLDAALIYESHALDEDRRRWWRRLLSGSQPKRDRLP